MSSTASSRSLGSGGIRLDRSLVSNLTKVVIFAAQAMLLVLAAVLFSRWLGGAFSRPAPGLPIATAVVVSAIAVAFRLWLALGTQYLVLSTVSDRWATPSAVLLFALPGLASLLTLLAISVPGTSAIALTFSWLIFLVVEVASWLLFYVRERQSSTVQSLHGQTAPPAEFADALAPDAVQQMTRTRDDTGAETISALVRVEFAASERLQVVHLAFCPPLGRVPTVALEQLDGPEVELRTTNVQTFGTRIEVRLIEELSDSRSAVVQVYAATVASEPAASDHLP